MRISILSIFWSIILLGIVILLISLSVYTVKFVNWKESISCNEVKKFAWNSPLGIPEEIKENVTRCYTSTFGGNSKTIKLFELGNYIGSEYFGNYEFDFFGNPYKV
jgi:hypothetical protein